MQKDGETSRSIWMERPAKIASHSLKLNAEADVCVIGAGIAGLTTAYLLSLAGKKVVVIDKGAIAGGQTARTTAHLVSAIDDRFFNIEYLHGLEGARLAAESHASAIDQIESICTQESIDCDFRRLPGYLFLAPGDSPELLKRECAAAHRLGVRDAEILKRTPLASLSNGPCLKFPRQGQLNPARYLEGLAHAILKNEGEIYTQTRATKIEGESALEVHTEQGASIIADAVVVATNTPIIDRVVIHTKQAPYRSYAMAFEIPEGSVPPALFWDTLDSYHYIRTHKQGDEELLIVGGEDHRTGQSPDEERCHEKLEHWAREHFPTAGRVRQRWSGQVIETVDGLAFIGKNPLGPKNVYIASGDSGMGMTHGTIAGRIISDLI